MPLLVTARQMREIESAAVEAGATWHGLMEHAGAEVAKLTIRWVGAPTEQRVTVLVGPGNNGGDGLVAARHFARHGWPVECWVWSRRENRPDLIAALTEKHIPIREITADNIDKDFTSALRHSTLVLDGLLGTGLERPVEGQLAHIVSVMNSASVPVVAIDIPTGINSDTGAVLGSAVRAKMTVALGYLKYGHVLPPGKFYSGEILLGEIGLDERTSKANSKGELLSAETIRAKLPSRPDDAHKGDFGKAMVVAGSINYVGAAALAVQGAMRSGVGMVTLGCPGDLLGMLAAKLTECTFLPLPSDLGVLAAHAADKLRNDLDGYKSLLIGCGIGQDKATVSFLRNLLGKPEGSTRPVVRSIGFATRVPDDKEAEASTGGSIPPLVLDADALNILADWDEWKANLPEGSVLTPHAGELARLLSNTTEEVQADRVAVAKKAAKDWKQIVVLKGAATVVADPAGKVFISPFSNPALATAGSGDVLAGCIAGLIAQGMEPVDAACAGVYLHGMAGELLREEYGVSGGLAGDLPVLLARAGKTLRED